MRVKKDGIALLTECERQVMKCTWDQEGDAHLPVVLQMVNEQYNKNWKPQTISTFVTRLRDKGFLSLGEKAEPTSIRSKFPRKPTRRQKKSCFGVF